MFTLIGAILGYIFYGFPGLLLGLVFGRFIDIVRRIKVVRTGYFTSRENFLNMLLVLTSAVAKADSSGRMLRSELQFVKSYLLHTFGPEVTGEALYRLRDYLEQDFDIPTICHQFSLKATIQEKLTLLDFLFGLSGADGTSSNAEMEMIQNISDWMGISRSDFESLKAMFFFRNYSQQQRYSGGGGYQQSRQESYIGSYTRENDYKILEVDPNASDEEVKKAYRKMAMKHHPDKVNHLGEEVRKQAEEKFKLLNEAYDRIKKERNMN